MQARGQWNIMIKCQTINLELYTQQNTFQEQEQNKNIFREIKVKIYNNNLLHSN